MANDNQAHFARIGFVVVFGVAAILAALIYLGGFGASRDEVLAETCSDASVSGLSVGSVVNFRGVKVGEVKKISFVGAVYDGLPVEDKRKVWILMSFDSDVLGSTDRDTVADRVRRMVANGVRATVSASGITGLSHIELNVPRNPAPLKAMSWTPRNIFIPPEPSMLESFSDAAERIVRQVDKIDFLGFWSNVSSVAESAARVADEAKQLLECNRAGIDAVVRNVEGATEEVGEFVRELRANPSLLLRSADAEPLPETE